MQKTVVVSNAHVQVLWQQQPEMVVVTDLRNIQKQQPFSGFDGLEEMYNDYCQSFSEAIGFKETCEYFKPNILTTVINAPAN